MRTQPTNAFFATVTDQMFGGSSQLPTTAVRAVIKSLSRSDNETVLGSNRKLGGVAEHLIGASRKNEFEF